MADGTGRGGHADSGVPVDSPVGGVGNLFEPCPVFVGRATELADLYGAFRTSGSATSVVVVHGASGVGKTELALQYAAANRDYYAGGCWRVGALGHSRLLPALAGLLDDPTFGVAPLSGGTASSTGEDSIEFGMFRVMVDELRLVPTELARRAATTGPVLVIIDDVADPQLLAAAQLDLLADSGEVHLLVTTVLARQALPVADDRMRLLELGELPVAARVELVRAWQPHPQVTSDSWDESSVRGLTEMIGGLPVVVEQVATNLAAPGASAAAFATTLRLSGQRPAPVATLKSALVGLDQSALDVLAVAAFIGSDVLPWEWVREVFGYLMSDRADGGQHEWDRAQQVLLARRLVVATARADVVRIHPLVAVAATHPSDDRIPWAFVEWTLTQEFCTDEMRACPPKLDVLPALTMTVSPGPGEASNAALVAIGTLPPLAESRLTWRAPGLAEYARLIADQLPRDPRIAETEAGLHRRMGRLLLRVDPATGFKHLQIGLDSIVEASLNTTGGFNRPETTIYFRGQHMMALLLASDSVGGLDDLQAVRLNRMALDHARFAWGICRGRSRLRPMGRSWVLVASAALVRSLWFTDSPAGAQQGYQALAIPSGKPSSDPEIQAKAAAAEDQLRQARDRCLGRPPAAKVGPAEQAAELSLLTGLDPSPVPDLASRVTETQARYSRRMGIQIVLTIAAAFVLIGGIHLMSSNSGDTYRSSPVAIQEVSTCWISAGNAYCQDATAAGRELPQPIAVQGLPGRVTAISSDGDHVCAAASGNAYCWGDNLFGRLGNGTEIDTAKPVRVVRLPGPVTAINTGVASTCAVATGKAYCWGSNRFGQLGNGTKLDSTKPQKVVGLPSRVTAIDTGFASTCAVATGKAYCWGSNQFGQLGNGMKLDSSKPVPVAGLPGQVSVIDSDEGSTCAVASGRAYCWGAVISQEGAPSIYDEPDTRNSSVRPVAVKGLPMPVKSVVTSGSFICAVAAGKAYCWGSNSFGQLGNGTRIGSDKAVPVVALPGRVTSIADESAALTVAASRGMCAVANERVYCWGGDDAEAPHPISPPGEASDQITLG